MNPVENQRVNWVGIASIWIGGMVSIPSLLIGSTLIGGMNFYQALISGLLGIGFVVIFMCLESTVAVEFRLNTIELAKSAFGNKGGALLVGAIVGLATMGWFGVQTNIAGLSFSKILKDTLAIDLPAYISSFFWGLIMLLTAVYGFKLMKWLNYLAVPAIVLLMIYGLGVSFSEKGWSDVSTFEPATSMNFLSAIGLAIGFVSVGGVISPDINRFSATKKDAILGSIFGLLPAGLLLLGIGAILGILQGTHDITEIFSQLGYPVLALSILILATWTTNVVNAYSGGLALNQLLGLPEGKRPISTLIAGLIGTGLAVGGILHNFMDFLGLLTTTIPPVAGVLIADYWLARSFQAKSSRKVNWKGFLGWLCGVATMVFIEDPIKNLLAIVVSALVFWGAHKILPR